MQTNLKWGYLYWQPISLKPPTTRNRWPERWTRLQRKQEGQEHQKPPSFPPTPALLCDDYRLELVYVFDSVVILCTCETDPAFHETSLFKDHLPTILGYQEPGFQR